MSAENAATKSGGGILGTIERMGNKVPHPVMMFLYLIIGVIVLSAILALLGVSVTEEVAVPVPGQSSRQPLRGQRGAGLHQPNAALR